MLETVKLEELNREYEAKGEITVDISSIDDIKPIERALGITSYRVQRNLRGFTRYYNLQKEVAKKLAHNGWLQMNVTRHSTGAAEIYLESNSWIPAARGQVMSESGGAGFGPYEYDGYSAKVGQHIYTHGTREQIELMETLIRRIMGKRSLPWDIYTDLACCMLKKYDYKWFKKCWASKYPERTEAMDNWVDISPMADETAWEIYNAFQSACKEAAEEFRAQYGDRGVCGFGSVHVPLNTPFGKWLAKMGDLVKAWANGGYVTLNADIPFLQSLDYKEHSYRAGMRVLRTFGVEHQPNFMID